MLMKQHGTARYGLASFKPIIARDISAHSITIHRAHHRDGPGISRPTSAQRSFAHYHGHALTTLHLRWMGSLCTVKEVEN